MMGTNWDEINSENESRLIQDVEENGAIFGGQDDPALRQRAETAESRRFGEGAFEHVVDFAGDDCALVEAAWSDQFGQNAFSTVGLGLSAGRKGKMCLPLLGLPNLMFERLEIELTLDGEFPGPGRTGVSVDGGKTHIYKPLQKLTDWTDVVKGYSRVLWRFEICNQRERKEGESVKIGYRNCLNTVTLRGGLVKHR